MSSLVLLNKEGLVFRTLQLVSLPNDYVVPEGMTVSWRTAIRVYPSDPLVGLRGPQEPVDAFFYLGKAFGQVSRDGFMQAARDAQHRLRFGVRDLTVTVQGTTPKDVNDLRDRILQLIRSGSRWNVSNDLNPKPKKPGLLQKLKKMFGAAK